MIKYYETITNTRGDSLPNYRVQVVDSAGAAVSIYADGSGTVFTDDAGNTVNYATADPTTGKAAFYWTPATGQVLQILDLSGELVDATADFADKYVIANLPGEIAQSAVTDLTDDLAAKAATAALAASTGAALVGAANGGTVEDTIARLFVNQYFIAGDADYTNAIDRALDAAHALTNGAVIEFNPATAYVNTGTHFIIGSGIVLEGNGALITGSGRFLVCGNTAALTRETITTVNYITEGDDGGWDHCIERSGIRNLRFGGSHSGPIYSWVRNPVVDGITSEPGRTSGTFLNLYFIDGMDGRDITIWDSEVTKIGVLLFHTRNCKLSNVNLRGGEYVYGVQIKGGWNNVVQGSIDDCVTTHAFRIRGDAPFQASDTAATTTYPFADLNGEASRALAWASSDSRRATVAGYFRDCAVTNTTGVHYLAQEFYDSGFDDCESDASGSQNAAINKAFASGERGFRLRNFRGTGDAGTSRIVGVTGFSITDQLEGFVMEGGIAEGATAATAIRLIHVSRPDVRDVLARNNTGQIAMDFVDCIEPTITRPRGSGNGTGLSVTSTNLTGGRTATITNPEITGTSIGISCSGAHRIIAGKGHTGQTTGSSTLNAIQRYNIPTGETRMIYVKIAQIRRDSGLTRITEKKCAAYNNAGTLAWVGTSGGDTISDYDSTTASVANTFSISGTQVRLNLASTAGGSVVADHYILESRMETF